MSKKGKIPDAWDDDWEAIADKADLAAIAKEEEEEKISKKERLARHAETNKKIWESAEKPETFHFLAANESKVPLRSEFKPQLKVLSRKPAPKESIDPVTGLAKISIEDDEDEGESKNKPTAEELRLEAQRKRDERQKQYDEARARILGTSSGTSSPGAVTPPKSRGSGRGPRSGNGNQNGTKELFDPNYTAKPGAISIQKRNGEGPSRSGASTPRNEDLIVRAPRGPDASGKGFAKRGGKNA